MTPWIQVAVPHADIRDGRLDESVFAADLSDVVADRGPLEYRDAAMFFRKTYPAQGLVQLLSSVTKRLSGQGGGEAVIQIQTPFGGGKTHSLIALYHLVKHGEKLGGALLTELRKAGIQPVPGARVVTFVGTASDALKGKTPWGEIAHQLGRYEFLAEHDRKRRAPGKDLLHQLLGAQPTLILMDEIAQYAVKARDFRDQLVAFCQELTETVKVLPRSALVVTLPSSVPYDEEGERALHALQQVFGRVESIRIPVEGEEIFEVIRRRLFERVGDPDEVNQTVEAFFELYHRLGDDVPREAREPAYRERMRKAYPFHPELIDVLFERWSTYPNFQRTRGVLRLLALVVSRLYQVQHAAPLILPAHLDLADPALRGEFLRHIGNEYQGVIASDIAANGNARAEQIGRELGSAYASFGVASGIARAIFFMSFSGSERRGVSIQRLRLGVLQPGLQPAIIGDALLRLEDELWYLHVDKGIYHFSSQRNLNRAIVEKEEAIQPSAVEDEIRKRLGNLAGSDMQAILWPRTAQDVPDTKSLKLAILPLDHPYPSEATRALAQELLNKCGQAFRVYRNTLLLLAANADALAEVRQLVKRYLAYSAVRSDETVWQQLSEESHRALEHKLAEAEGGISHRLLVTYRHLAKADELEVRWFDIGLPTTGAKPSLARRVREYLLAEDVLLEKVSPNYILDKAIATSEQEKTVDDIYEAFLRYPSLPIVENKQVILDAIARGAEQGAFGLKLDDRIYAKERVSPVQLEAGAVVVREPVPKAAHTPEPTPAPSELSNFKPQADLPLPRDAVAQTLKLDVVVPWDKLAAFVRGVIVPLRDSDQRLKLELRLILEAQGAISQQSLSIADETLRQIGAEVKERRLIDRPAESAALSGQG